MKIFIVSKVYDTETKTIAEIQEEVQKDLDSFVGKNKVEFKLYNLGKANMDYSSESVFAFSSSLEESWV